MLACCAQEHIYLSSYILLTGNYASNTGGALLFNPRKFVMLIANVIWTMVLGNTESLNYADSDGTCDHSWLMMFLENAPQLVALSNFVQLR